LSELFRVASGSILVLSTGARAWLSPGQTVQ
jgi:hypothetical protein